MGYQEQGTKMKTILLTVSMLVLFFCGCSEDKSARKSSAPGMKCGAGKCGANMFDGNAALVKRKKNILAQMRDNDPRKDCVKKAKTTKAVYDCVRDPRTGKMSMKCGKAMQTAQSAMKCGAGKCGATMK
jgi:uncharacterized low-complexity protein